MDADMPPISGFMSDSIGDRDSLGINPDVSALARLIAARNVEPPVSIGLFGTKGSGKSFFLQKLSQEVSALAMTANSALSETAYCARLVQVHYNVWQYMGANQWLALVERIFIELDHWWTRRDSSSAQPFLPVSTARNLLRDPTSRVERAVKLEAQAQSALTKVMSKHDEAVRAYAACIAKSRWPEVNRAFSKKFACDSKEGRELNQAGGRLGLENLSLNAEQLDRL